MAALTDRLEEDQKDPHFPMSPITLYGPGAEFHPGSLVATPVLLSLASGLDLGLPLC